MVGSEVKLVFAALGIYCCYVTYAILQEDMFKANSDGTKFTFTFFLLTIQCIINMVVAATFNMIFRRQEGEETVKFDGGWYKLLAQVGFTYVFAMQCSNESLKVGTICFFIIYFYLFFGAVRSLPCPSSWEELQDGSCHVNGGVDASEKIQFYAVPECCSHHGRNRCFSIWQESETWCEHR